MASETTVKTTSYSDIATGTLSVTLPIHDTQKVDVSDSKKNRGCIQKRWIMMIVVVLLVAACAVSFAVYKDINTKVFRKKELLQKYGSMFRHVNEMSTTDQLISQDRIPVDEETFETNETCTVSCQPKKENGSEREDPFTGKNQDKQYSFHGCCISYQQFFSPDYLKNTENKKRRLVQFKRRKQFFLQDVCRHMKDCKRGCKCMQQNIIVAALVVDDINLTENPSEEDELTFADARIENVVYPGWCKCFNQ